MDGQWLTYADAAVQLGVTPEAARRRAIRGKWARMPGNDGRARVRLADDWRPQGTPDVRSNNSALVHALEAHVATLKGENETLKSQLAAAEARVTAAEARAGKQAAENLRFRVILRNPDLNAWTSGWLSRQPPPPRPARLRNRSRRSNGRS
jgi:hypothetical protein